MTHSVFSPVFFEWNQFLTFNWFSVIVLINPIFVIFSGMSAYRFFSSFSRNNGLSSTKHDILEFQSFNQISVPNQTSIESFEIVKSFVNFSRFGASFLEKWLVSEYSGVFLHSFLDVGSEFSNSICSVGESYFIQIGD